MNYRTTIESTKLCNYFYYFTRTQKNKVRNNCINYCTIFLYTFHFDSGMQIASETRLYQTDQPTDQPTDIATYRAAIAAKNK